jgi:hypothetical protein
VWLGVGLVLQAIACVWVEHTLLGVWLLRWILSSIICSMYSELHLLECMLPLLGTADTDSKQATPHVYYNGALHQRVWQPA